MYKNTSTRDLKPRFESLETERPMIASGLDEETKTRLEKEGWIYRVIEGDRDDIPVVFKSDLPGGVVIKYGTIPDGAEVYENDLLGGALLEKCGNTCPILGEPYKVI